MSNFLAIATVTESIRQLLEGAIQPDFTESLNEARATAVRPNAGAEALPRLGVNIYLYQVNHNAAFRNADLPTRRGDGSVQQAPRAALDLHYLFSFYGDEGKLEPQQVMGSVIRTLHASPWLLQNRIAHIIQTNESLGKSNLDAELERIKLTPLPLTIEELSKIWSVFFSNSYTLSMAYTASVVFIEGREKPKAALPVKARNVYAWPMSFPVIDDILSQAGVDDPPVSSQRFAASGRMILSGRQLRADKTAVKIDGDEILSTQLLSVKQDAVTLELPPDLRSGAHSISVIHKRMIGTPPAEHTGVESNSAVFLLTPAITVPAAPVTPQTVSVGGQTTYSTTLSIRFEPACGRRQRVALTLNEYSETPSGPPVIYRMDAPKDNGINDPAVSATDTIEFTLITAAKPHAGQYLVRAFVDQAQSPVAFDPAAPLVEIADVP